MTNHIFHPSILRAYDIRGIVDDTLSLADARAIGLSFAACLERRGHKNHVVVGRDGRLSSPALSTALCDGLVEGGARVSDIGCGSTPMLYFAGISLQADGAIQVTGSHNPSDHNGFKMVMNGTVFFGDDIQELGITSAAGLPGKSGGSLKKTPIFDTYINRLVTDADTGNFNVIWDCGNGATGPATIAATQKISGTHTVLFGDIDGHFPNHHPNPVDPKTLTMLRQAVSKAGADLGIGFDGDGDRIGIIDAKGRQVPGDFLTAFLAQSIVHRHPGAPIILDVKSSDMAIDLITAAGGNAQIWKTGHSHMKTRMAAIKAPLAGEMSGHIFIQDGFYGFDDALYVAIRILSQMAKTGQSITDFVDRLPPQHATPELRIDCPDDVKFSIINRIADYVKTQTDPMNLTLIDGVRVRINDGWWLVRASNTEAALVARAEGKTPAVLARLVKDIETALAAAGLEWTRQ
jgi:phosphomannomutase